MQEIAAGVFVDVTYQGANVTAVRTAAGVVAIDSPWLPREAQGWARAVRALGDPQALILTEPHSDHVFGASWLAAPTVVGHRLTAERLASEYADREAYLVEYREETRVWARPEDLEGLDAWQPVVPDLVFETHLTLRVGDRTFDLYHLPGHTAAQTAVHLPEARLLATGDNLFNRLPAWIGTRVPLATWLASLDRIAAFDVDRVVPGHGSAGGREVIAFTREYLTGLQDAVARALAEGWSREEAVRRIPPPAGAVLPTSGWAVIFQQAVANLYEQMAR